MAKKTSRSVIHFLIPFLCLFLLSCGGSEGKFSKHFEKGKGYYSSSKYKEAAIEFKNAAELKPDDAQAHYYLGLSCLKMGEPVFLVQAFKSLSKAVELDPKLSDAHVKIGELYLLSKDLVKAGEQADLVLKSEPDGLDANLLKASVLAAGGKLKEAEKVLVRISSVHADSIKPLLLLANVRTAAGNREAARESLKAALSIKPGSVEPRIALARIGLMENRPAQAEEELNAALKDNPGNVAVLAALVDVYVLTGRTAFAEDAARKIVEASGNKAESYVVLASIQRASGSKEKARETLRQGIEHSTDPMKLQKVLAGDYLDDKDLAKASELVDAILSSKAKDAEGLFLRGRLRLAENKPKEALADLNAYIEYNPRSPLAHYFYGVGNMMAGNASTAKEAFNQALSLAPGLNEASFMLAAAYLETGEVKLAETEAQKLYSRKPDYPGLSVLMGDIRLRQGRTREAIQAFETFSKNNPNDAKGFARLALAYRAAGNGKKAVENAERAVSLNPDLTDTLAIAISIDLASRDFNRALTRVNGQIEKNPKKPGLYLLLGKVHAANNDAAQAESAFKKALELDANYFPAYVEAGNLYARKGSFDDALKQYRESVRVNPKALASYMIIGLLNEKKGDYQGAIASYKKALEIEPKFAPAANNLAWIYSEKDGNLDVALTLAETAKELLPNEAAVSDTLGWIYYKKQAYLKAVTLLKESAGKLPNDPSVKYHLGMAYFAKGDKALAKQELTAALAIKADFPGAEEARKTLAGIK